MKSRFDEFIETIPVNIHSNTKSYLSKNIAIFIPEEFLIERKMITEDYHFVIFYTTPPSMSIKDKEYKFKKGSFICLEPGIEIKVDQLDSVGSVNFISICVKTDFFEKIAHEVIDKEKIIFKKTNNAYSHQLLDLIEVLVKELIEFSDICPVMINSIETQIVIQLLRDSMPGYLVDKKRIHSDNDYISKAIKYMEEYYSSNITINEICSIIFISSCHFQRIFKKHMNQTPYSYLMNIRISKAKEKLEGDTVHIEEVARNCGFVSTAHFSSVFKRIEGVSPTEYRRRNLINHE